MASGGTTVSGLGRTLTSPGCSWAPTSPFPKKLSPEARYKAPCAAHPSTHVPSILRVPLQKCQEARGLDLGGTLGKAACVKEDSVSPSPAEDTQHELDSRLQRRGMSPRPSVGSQSHGRVQR